MYQYTDNDDTVLCLDTGYAVARGTWMWDVYEAWLSAGNTPQPAPGSVRTRQDLKDATTAHRWDVETGGIMLNGVQVGTTLDDQNRLSGVLSAIALGGLEEVDFKAQNGWVKLTAAELQGIALAISQHVQACFTAERAHHETIDALAEADVAGYDVTQGWP